MKRRQKSRKSGNRSQLTGLWSCRANQNLPYKKLVLESLEDRRLLSVALFTNSSLTTSGLVGSYVNKSLQTYSAQDDWRSTQSISGTRVDANLNFTTDTWGTRSTVGVTGGSNEDWDNFSVQWDGYLQVPQSGPQVATVSDDGSRMWIDLNKNGTFESSELLDNGWGNVQGYTTGQRSPALPAGTYPIRIQYYENSGGNDFSLAESSYIPTQFVATPSNPKQTVRVLVLNYDPVVPGKQNQLVHQVFGWQDPHRLATDLEGDMEWASGGAVDLQVVEWRDMPDFPAYTDNFQYTPDEYVTMWQNTPTNMHAGDVDFYHVAEQQGIAALVNSHAIDEVWCFGPPGLNLWGEDWMFGPNSFFINGPSFPEIGVDRAIAGHSFNYERGPDCTIHDIGHQMENIGARAYGGSWSTSSPTTTWDFYTTNYEQSPTSVYGVGSCHNPANAEGGYDYGNTLVVQSTAYDWLNYPNLTGATTEVSRDTWGFGPSPDYGRDYLVWFFGLLPRANGTTPDGRQNNWYKYLYDFNSYEWGTGLPRNEDAFAGAATVNYAGGTSYDFSVTYYDQTHIDAASIDTGDVRVTTPSGTFISPTMVVSNIERTTTAGTARTVTYRITPPGGSWDLADNGTYQITMRNNQVRDTAGHYVPSGYIGSFRVAETDPSLLDINAIVAAGGAAITHTDFDIGSAANVFDGNSASIARSANINPAFIQVAFEAPHAVLGFKVYFLGDTLRWQVETADTQADMDSKIGTYHLAVSPVTFPANQLLGYTLTTPATAKLFKLTYENVVGDNYVHIGEWQMIGSAVSPESNPPVPTATFADMTSTGSTSHFVNVTYTDNTRVDMNWVGTGDITVTGPNGFSAVPFYYDSSNDHTNGISRTVTYWFIPPGGYWNPDDNGTYTVTMQPNRIRDIFGNAASQAIVVGTFQVNAPLPVRRPAADLTELNAAQWTGWADGGTASASDDSTRKTTGSASVRFETTGNFDTSLSFPPTYAADWDLTAATNFHFSVYAVNTNDNGFQTAWIRLKDSTGNYADYRYQDEAAVLNNARNQWKSYTVPLNPTTGWQRTTTGTLHLNHITSIEFHADTWGGGFSLWYDNVGFNVPTVTVYTWDGGGTNNLWSNDANWVGNIAPSPRDNLVFPAGANRMINVNDFTGVQFGSITVSGGNYQIQNNPIQSSTVEVKGNAILNASSIVCDTLSIGSTSGAASNAIPELVAAPFVAGAMKVVADVPPIQKPDNTAITSTAIENAVIIEQSIVVEASSSPAPAAATEIFRSVPEALPIAFSTNAVVSPATSTAEIAWASRLPEQSSNVPVFTAMSFVQPSAQAFPSPFKLTEWLKDSVYGELTDSLSKSNKQSSAVLTESQNAHKLSLQSIVKDFRDSIFAEDSELLDSIYFHQQDQVAKKAVDEFLTELFAANWPAADERL